MAKMAPAIAGIAGTVIGSFIGFPQLGLIFSAVASIVVSATPCTGPRIRLEDLREVPQCPDNLHPR